MAKSVNLTLTFPMRVSKSNSPDGRFLKIALKGDYPKLYISGSLETQVRDVYRVLVEPNCS